MIFYLKNNIFYYIQVVKSKHFHFHLNVEDLNFKNSRVRNMWRHLRSSNCSLVLHTKLNFRSTVPWLKKKGVLAESGELQLWVACLLYIHIYSRKMKNCFFFKWVMLWIGHSVKTLRNKNFLKSTIWSELGTCLEYLTT